MPARKPVASPESVAIDEILVEDDATVEAIALQAGPPPDASRLSEREEDDAWEFEDRAASDNDTLAEMLMTQGLPPEIAGRLWILKLRPDWAPLYQRPTQDAEMADQLARIARWPFRLSVTEDIDDPDEWVEKSEALERRMNKRMTARQEQEAMPRQTQAGAGYGGSDAVG